LVTLARQLLKVPSAPILSRLVSGLFLAVNQEDRVAAKRWQGWLPQVICGEHKMCAQPNPMWEPGLLAMNDDAV
jgi:hypothetical protein